MNVYFEIVISCCCCCFFFFISSKVECEARAISIALINLRHELENFFLTLKHTNTSTFISHRVDKICAQRHYDESCMDETKTPATTNKKMIKKMQFTNVIYTRVRVLTASVSWKILKKVHLPDMTTEKNDATKKKLLILDFHWMNEWNAQVRFSLA